MSINESLSLERRLAAYGRILDDPSTVVRPVADPRPRPHKRFIQAATVAAVATAAFTIAALSTSSPGPARVVVVADRPDASLAFPVAGNASFVDTWGAPRRQGTTARSTQQGIEIFAPVGTPVRAMRSGMVNRVGVGVSDGKHVWVTDDDGNSYSYANLDRFASNLRNGRTVSTGEIIGYVGIAPGGPPTTPAHVHVEVHVAGAFPVNPFPILQALKRGVVDGAGPLPEKIRVRHRFGASGFEIVEGTPAESFDAATPLLKLSDPSLDAPDFTATSSLWTTSIEELRRKHCGNTIYGVYLLPSTKCSLPVPIPSPNNAAMIGNLVTFTEIDGAPIRTSSPIYRWLTKRTGSSSNAARLDLVNLDSHKPSEWHWYGSRSSEIK